MICLCKHNCIELEDIFVYDGYSIKIDLQGVLKKYPLCVFGISLGLSKNYKRMWLSLVLQLFYLSQGFIQWWFEPVSHSKGKTC